MAAIIITRKTGFRRGDESIRISVDGKTAGTLVSDNPLRLDLSPGPHQIKAHTLGWRGKIYQLNLIGADPVNLQVVVPVRTNFWWAWLPFVFIVTPAKAFGKYGTYIQFGLWVISLVSVLVWQWPYIRQRVRLEPVPVEGQMSPAGNTA